MIHFTADTHFGCSSLVKNLRHMDIEEHDALLIDNINRCVAVDDTLIIVGDFCKEKPGKYRQQIRCKHTKFILGNHDNEHKIINVFGGNVWHMRMVKCFFGDVFCCHYPMAYWDKSHHGSYHAYGHIHNSGEREAVMNKAFPGRRSMDVGVDYANWMLGEYRPFSEEEFFHCLQGEGHDKIKEYDSDY